MAPCGLPTRRDSTCLVLSHPQGNINKSLFTLGKVISALGTRGRRCVRVTSNGSQKGGRAFQRRGVDYKGETTKALLCPACHPCLLFLQELTAAVRISTGNPGNRASLWHRPNATNVCRFVPGFAVDRIGSLCVICRLGYVPYRDSKLTKLLMDR